MFGFGKKKPQPEEQHTLKLPLLESKDFTPDKIAEYLRSGIPILAVTDPSKQTQIDGHWNFEMLVGVEGSSLYLKANDKKEGFFFFFSEQWVFTDLNTLDFTTCKVPHKATENQIHKQL